MLGLFASCVVFTKELQWEMRCESYSKTQAAYVMGKLSDFIQIKIQLQLIEVLLHKGLIMPCPCYCEEPNLFPLALSAGKKVLTWFPVKKTKLLTTIKEHLGPKLPASKLLKFN